MIKRLFLAALLFVSGAAGAASLLPCDGTFESGVVATCFPRNQSGATSISTVQAHAPSAKSLRYFAGDGDSSGNTNLLIGDQSTVYVRFWWYVPNDVGGGLPGQHMWRLTRAGVSNDFQGGQIDSIMHSGRSFGVDLFDGGSLDTSGPYEDLFTLPADTFFKFEALFILNTGSSFNGTMKFVVNDVVQYSSTTVKYKDSSAPLNNGWNIWNQWTNFSNQGAPMYADDVYVSNVDEIGGGGGGGGTPTIKLPITVH